VRAPTEISRRPGQLVLPYVNTNLDYQPDKIISSMNAADLGHFLRQKKFALAAVFSRKISGNGYARLRFSDRVDSFFGNGTLVWNNGTLGGMPVSIHIEHRKGNSHRNVSVIRFSLSVFVVYLCRTNGLRSCQYPRHMLCNCTARASSVPSFEVILLTKNDSLM